jgi:hypothetical protein
MLRSGAAATDAVELPEVARWARVWLTRSLLPYSPFPAWGALRSKWLREVFVG